MPDEHASHATAVKIPAGLVAILRRGDRRPWCTRSFTFGNRSVPTTRSRSSLSLLYAATWNKWWFDELYDYRVRSPHAPHQPVHRPHARSRNHRWHSSIPSPGSVRGCAQSFRVAGDRYVIDNLVDTFAGKTWDLGLSLRSLQTGRLRQYVMFIVVGTSCCLSSPVCVGGMPSRDEPRAVSHSRQRFLTDHDLQLLKIRSTLILNSPCSNSPIPRVFLSWLVFLPAVVALVIAFVPLRGETLKWISLGATAIVFFMTLCMIFGWSQVQFQAGVDEMQNLFSFDWIPIVQHPLPDGHRRHQLPARSC